MKRAYIKPQVIPIDMELPLLSGLSKTGGEDNTGNEDLDVPGMGEFSKGTSWDLWEDEGEEEENSFIESY